MHYQAQLSYGRYGPLTSFVFLPTHPLRFFFFVKMYLFHQRSSKPSSGTLLRKTVGTSNVDFLGVEVANGEIVKEENQLKNGWIEVSTQKNVKGYLRDRYLFPAVFVHQRSSPPNFTMLRSVPNTSNTWVMGTNNQVVDGT